MNFKKKIQILLEISAAILLLLPLLSSIYCFVLSWYIPNQFNSIIQFYNAPFIPFLTLLTCLILTLWLIVGEGVNSNLWNWLPPFVFFRNFGRYGKLFIIIGLIVVSLIGLIKDWLV